MEDNICYKCKKSTSEGCKCKCFNCGDSKDMIYTTCPICAQCFGIFLAQGIDPSPDNPLRMITVAGKPVKGKEKKDKKEILLGFMKDQGWTKRVLENILKEI